MYSRLHHIINDYIQYDKNFVSNVKDFLKENQRETEDFIESITCSKLKKEYYDQLDDIEKFFVLFLILTIDGVETGVSNSHTYYPVSFAFRNLPSSLIGNEKYIFMTMLYKLKSSTIDGKKETKNHNMLMYILLKELLHYTTTDSKLSKSAKIALFSITGDSMDINPILKYYWMFWISWLSLFRRSQFRNLFQ